MKRSFLSQLLTLLLCIVGINAWADNSGSCGDGVTWTLSNDTLIIGYSGNGTGKMDDYYQAGQPWYSYRDSITTIVIDEGVTSIGNGNFNECYRLTSITVNTGNTIYDSRDSCNAIIETSTNTLIVGCKSTIIPSSVASIGRRAFYGCSGLASIVFPNSVISIDERAFYDCNNLNSVTFSNSLSKIGYSAFDGCRHLASVIIPNSVTEIGNGVFNRCSDLTSIVVLSGNAIYDSRDSCNAIIETSTNTLISGCKSTIIPSSVALIGKEAFYSCNGLHSITIPNGVTGIGDNAFGLCINLYSVIIPNSVTSIGSNAFSGCALTAVAIGSNVSTIDRGAFSGCRNLTSVIIPNRVTRIIEHAFEGCPNLTSIYSLNENPRSINTNVFEKNSYDTCILYVPVGTIDKYRECSGWKEFKNIIERESNPCGDGVTWALTDGVLTISYSGEGTGEMDDYYSNDSIPWYLYKSSITAIVIEDGVTSIGKEAFASCNVLTSVTLPNSLVSIGLGAFCLCKSLTSITIPNSVKSIGNSAFFYCFNLSSVEIGNSVTSIGDNAFFDCRELSSVYSLIENPTDISSSAFVKDTYDNCTLYVPVGTVDKYKECTGWKEFLNIKEGAPTGISTINIDKKTGTKYYTIDGRRISKPQKGLNIINGKKVIVK